MKFNHNRITHIASHLPNHVGLCYRLSVHVCQHSLCALCAADDTLFPAATSLCRLSWLPLMKFHIIANRAHTYRC